MSVIIRLQNLPWSANALDIRQYFHGLSIPEGGVHIVGGELGDAFIAFSTDEDARQAFMRNHGKIKEVQISLNLSSRTEMQKVIEEARNKSYSAFMPSSSNTNQSNAGPTTVPQTPIIMPAPIPELKKSDNDSKRGSDRKRSRSRSRERKDRSRDHKDRKRDRSRSRERSRDKRRDRRERSRSRGRSRSKDRDRKKRSPEKTKEKDKEKPRQEVWAKTNQQGANTAVGFNPLAAAPLLANLQGFNLDGNLGALNALAANLQNNPNLIQNPGNVRNSWPPSLLQNSIVDLSKIVELQNNLNNRFFQGNEEVIGSNTCVCLEPFYGGYSEIRRFFQGNFISNKGIKFINDVSGKRTGIVYIQFGSYQGKKEALKLSGTKMNGNKVEIRHIDDAIFEAAVDRFIPNDDSDVEVVNTKPPPRRYDRYRNRKYEEEDDDVEEVITDFSCVTVEDLPTYVKEQDILHMFSLHPLFSLILTTKPKGGHIAYVKFSNSEVAKKALEEKNHHVVGGKPVKVKPCRDEDFDLINKQHEVDLDSSNKTVDIGTDCLHILRLPQTITDRDIADIFSDIGVVPAKIHLISNNMGFTGQAYCEFESMADASKAVMKDGTLLGNNQISMKPISRQEVHNILHNMNSPNSNANNSHPGPPERMPFMHNMRPPFRQPFLPRNFDMRGPRFPPRGPGGPRPRFPHHMNGNNGEESAPPGCTVYLDNVPYKAGTNEILAFFDGYNISSNVSRRYNANNTPSGEAKVTFFSPDEAFRAVQEKQGHKIWQRNIFLKQA